MGVNESRREGPPAEVHGPHATARRPAERFERPYGLDPFPANEHRLTVSVPARCAHAPEESLQPAPQRLPRATSVQDAPAVEEPPRFGLGLGSFHRRAT